MKLTKFIKNKKVKNTFITLSIIFLILIVGIVLYRSYAIYQEDKTYNILKGKVGEFIEGGNDIRLAVLVNGKQQSTFPGKYEGYEVKNITCTNNATAAWDSEAWSITIDDLETSSTLCTVNFTRYEEEILNGAAPVFGEGLIPVVIADNGTVTKADIQNEWYNYTNKVWANAVILEDESKTYNDGDTIPESNIESYFVWIPRYKYKIWDEGKYTELTTIDTNKVHTIQVEFETTEDAESNGSIVNSWLTHPAFTSFDVNGIWVGKFESGYKGATASDEARVNTNEPEKLQIKPSVYSWRSIQPANAHLTSYNYKRELDSHMMKNTEWGAVAYLQHSAYGSQESVRINNNSSYLTGYAAVNEPTTGYTGTNISCSTNPEACNEYGTSTSIMQVYNTEIGYKASTTGNISGVYDMSGGAWEYMMGVLADEKGNPMSGRHNVYNSGFIGTYGCPTCNSTLSGIDSTISENTEGIEWPEEKYYDLYVYNTSYKKYTNRILGDATGELGSFQEKIYASQMRQIGSWYGDESWFVYSENPLFYRGGGYYVGNGAGVFNFVYTDGRISSGTTFRVVLAI